MATNVRQARLYVSAARAVLEHSPLLRDLVANVTEDEIEFETFERRYREEVLGQGSLVQWFTCVGAWARKRVAT